MHSDNHDGPTSPRDPQAPQGSEAPQPLDARQPRPERTAAAARLPKAPLERVAAARTHIRSGVTRALNGDDRTPAAEDAAADQPADEPLGPSYHRGPVLLRGNMIPSETTTEHLLSPEESTDWLHMDPWRVLRIQAEFVDGFGALAEIGPAVACYGSARTKRSDPMYRSARHIGRKIAQHGIAVITGGGPGIMEAVNRGAAVVGGKSVGLGIELPHEEGINRWVNIGMTFRYFFVRKTMFVKYSDGAIVFPGGFGTLDEAFELLTLVQTHKVAMTPIVMFGTEYWRGLFTWLEGTVLEEGMISPLDPSLVKLTDDEDEAVEVALSKIREAGRP